MALKNGSKAEPNGGPNKSSVDEKRNDALEIMIVAIRWAQIVELRKREIY